MKLAEALINRADIQTRLTKLTARIRSSAMVQKGEKPPENPEKLLREAMGLIADLKALVVRINRTNLSAKLADGRSLTEAIAERDRLKTQHALLLTVDSACKASPERTGLSEIKWVPQFDSAKLQKQADDVSKKLRELNIKIQKCNWEIDIED